ncbi:hypothetical protein A9Q99_20515 [Gammaproteobacteria bacterium 45_16_T64]|nr:hypothetical protein A9Q99_20515 [Gammaproteobacteria bacterium 45_16_T64]
MRLSFFALLLIVLSATLEAKGFTVQPNTLNKTLIEVDISAQPLEDALTQLATNHSIPIVFKSDSVNAFSAKPLKGTMSLRLALESLLVDIPLSFTIIDNAWVAITPTKKTLTYNSTQKKRLPLKIRPPAISEIVVVGEYLDLGCCRNSPSTATKTYIPTIEVPKSIEGISADLLKDRGNATLSEAFRAYSSINVTDLRGNINVRGFKLSNRSILKDGQSIVSHGISALTLNNIEGIEVVKGANSTLYGYGQPGAVINLITKKPRKAAFTNITLSTGNYDQYIAIDANSPTLISDDLFVRINGLFREEFPKKASRGALTQLELSPSISLQINDTDKLLIDINYSQQRINGHGGKRPFDQIEIADQFGIDFFDVTHPNWNGDASDFYPNTGLENEETHDSTVTELRINYQGLTRTGWDYSVNTYYGDSKFTSQYANDLNVWLNPAFDPQPFPFSFLDPLTYLKTLFDNNANFIQHYRDVRADFITLMQDEYGIAPEDVVDTLYNQGNDIPFWRDNNLRFYQVAFDQKAHVDQFNLDISISRDFFLFEQKHSLLLGLLHTTSNSEGLASQRYNKSLYEQGASLVSNASNNDDLFLGWALQRYAALPWYFPYHENNTADITLPTAISELAGIEKGQSFVLDGTFPYKISKTETTLSGVYLQDQISLSEHWKLLVSTGFYQYTRNFDTASLNSLFMLIGERQIISRSSTAHDKFFAPSIGVTYLPLQTLSFYANVGIQYDLLNGVNANQTALDPEKTETEEIGAKWWPTEDYSVSLTLFKMTKTNWLLTDGDNFGYLAQQGEFQSTGSEFSLVGFITPHIKTSLNFTKTKTESLKKPSGGRDDSFLNLSQVGVPSDSGSLWVQVHNQPFGTHDWSFGLGISYMGGRQFNQQFIESKFSEYTLVDVAITYLDEDFRIGLNADNITNEKWVIGSNATPQLSDSSRYLSEGHESRLRLTTEWFF